MRYAVADLFTGLRCSWTVHKKNLVDALLFQNCLQICTVDEMFRVKAFCKPFETWCCYTVHSLQILLFTLLKQKLYRTVHLIALITEVAVFVSQLFSVSLHNDCAVRELFTKNVHWSWAVHNQKALQYTVMLNCPRIAEKLFIVKKYSAANYMFVVWRCWAVLPVFTNRNSSSGTVYERHISWTVFRTVLFMRRPWYKKIK